MTHRLFLEPEVLANATASAIGSVAGRDAENQVRLDRARSHYLTRVLRLKKDASLLCFDGRGQEWLARVAEADPRACLLTLTGRSRAENSPGPRLVLAQAWLKGSAMDVVVHKSTELGATDIVPLLTSRTNVQLDEQRTASKLSHWSRITCSTCEQCGRLFLPEIHEPVQLGVFLDHLPTADCRFLDAGQPVLSVAATPAPMTIIVGPEGGWTPEERSALLAGGVRGAGLGDTTLRAETTPLAVLAAIRHSRGWR